MSLQPANSISPFVVDVSWLSGVRKLLGAVFEQLRNNCWAIALVTNLEFMLKFSGDLPQPWRLSLQEVMNYMPREFLRMDGGDGCAARGYDVVKCFADYGSVLEDVCPSSGQEWISPSRLTTGVRRYIPKEGTTITRLNYVQRFGSEEGCERFSARLREAMMDGPLCVAFKQFPSYLETADGIPYSPLPDEVRDYQNPATHSVLAVTYGHIDGSPYLDCRDSQGGNWGNYGNILVNLNTITHFMVIR